MRNLFIVAVPRCVNLDDFFEAWADREFDSHIQFKEDWDAYVTEAMGAYDGEMSKEDFEIFHPSDVCDFLNDNAFPSEERWFSYVIIN